MRAVVALLLLAAGCTEPESEGSDGPAVGSSVAPTIVLPDCPVDVAEEPSDWPLALPGVMVVSDYTVDDDLFRAEGVANDGETLLVQTMEETLQDYEVSEPDGGATDVVLAFQSETASGTMFMNDDDGDDCWDVEIEVGFFSGPELADFVENDDGTTETTTQSEASGLVESAGVGSVTTAQGAFNLFISQCQVEPVAIEASAPEGELTVVEVEGGDTSLVWTYTDGDTIQDATSKLIVSSADAALIVADGENSEGPETVIVDVTCIDS